jgi:hypothetical protein
MTMHLLGGAAYFATALIFECKNINEIFPVNLTNILSAAFLKLLWQTKCGEKPRIMTTGAKMQQLVEHF